jgi:hypothetical protein
VPRARIAETTAVGFCIQKVFADCIHAGERLANATAIDFGRNDHRAMPS